MTYRMKQKIIKTTVFCILICLILNGGMIDIIDCVTGVLHTSALGPFIISSGDCGKEGSNVNFELYHDGTLKISGTGEMMNYEPDVNPSPFDVLNDKIKKVVIENNVTSVSCSAFYNCNLIETIELSDTVSRIYSADETGLFSSKCLKNIYVDENNKTFCSIDGILFSKEIGTTEFYANYKAGNKNKYKIYTVPEDGYFLLEYPLGRTETKYTIPENVIGISSGAFRMNKHLKNIILPDRLTYIGHQAFAECTWIQRIVLPEKTDFLADGIFEQCLSLEEIYISRNVEAVCQNAFNDCPGLTDVYYDGTQEDWEKMVIDSGNDSLENVTIHYNYIQPEHNENKEIGSDTYHFFFNKRNIIPGDTVIVNAYKPGYDVKAIIYNGPGEVEWEISDRSVMDFKPYHNRESGEDVLYYPDTTQVQLRIKKFGESTLTMKLNGEDVCSTLIKITLSDDTIVVRYKQQILDSSPIRKMIDAQMASYNTINKFSEWDKKRISLMTSMDDLMGFGPILKLCGSALGLTTSQYEDYIDNTVNALIAEYLSIDTRNLSDFEDMVEKADLLRSSIDISGTEDDIIQTLAKQTVFSSEEIKSVFKVAGNAAESFVELQRIGITTVILAQFNIDVLQRLAEIVSSVNLNDQAPKLYASIKRTIKKVSNLEAYAERMKKMALFKQFVSVTFDEWIEYAGLTTLGFVLKAADFLVSVYKASGGIMADEYEMSYISLENATVLLRAIEISKNADDLSFEYGMYTSAIKVQLEYALPLAKNKNIEDIIAFHYQQTQKDCSYEDMMNEVRELIENSVLIQDDMDAIVSNVVSTVDDIVDTVKKTTSSGASTSKGTHNEEKLFMDPADIDIRQHDMVTIDKESAKDMNGKDCIILPGTVSRIEEYAFSEFHDMEYICLGSQLETIENGAFYGCDNLKFLTVPEQTKTIGNNAFAKCSSVEYLSINADSLGDGVFMDCTSLSGIRFNNRNTMIGDNAFEGCSPDLVITGYKNSTAEKYAQKYDINFEAIPEYVESLDILTPADKTSYTVGEEIDTSGMTVRAVYKDGTSEILSENWIAAYDTMTAGNKKAYVIYGEKSVSFDISVEQGKQSVLKLDNANLKMMYGTSRQLHVETDAIQPVIYTSSNPDIVSVTSGGYIRALKPGQVQLTANIANTEISSVCEIEVSDKTEIPEEKYVIFVPEKDNCYEIVLLADDKNASVMIYDELKKEVAVNKTDDLHWLAHFEHNKIYTVKINGTIRSGDTISIGEYHDSNQWLITNDKKEVISEIYAATGDSFKLNCQPPELNSTDVIYWESDNESVVSVDNDGNIKCIFEGDTAVRVRTSRDIAVGEILVHVVSNNTDKIPNDNETETVDSSHNSTTAIILIIIIIGIIASVFVFYIRNKKRIRR